MYDVLDLDQLSLGRWDYDLLLFVFPGYFKRADERKTDLIVPPGSGGVER